MPALLGSVSPLPALLLVAAHGTDRTPRLASAGTAGARVRDAAIPRLGILVPVVAGVSSVLWREERLSGAKLASAAILPGGQPLERKGSRNDETARQRRRADFGDGCRVGLGAGVRVSRRMPFGSGGQGPAISGQGPWTSGQGPAIPPRASTGRGSATGIGGRSSFSAPAPPKKATRPSASASADRCRNARVRVCSRSSSFERLESSNRTLFGILL